MMKRIKELKRGDIILFGTMPSKEWVVEDNMLKGETKTVYFLKIMQGDYKIMHIQDGNKFMNVVGHTELDMNNA